MSKPVLVVTTHFVDDVEVRIDRDFEVRRKPKGAFFTQEELLSAADGADAMLVTPFDKLDATFFQQVSSSMKVIATYSVGYDQIDLDAAAKRNIAIAHTPGVGADATADIAILLMLGLRVGRMRLRSWSGVESGKRQLRRYLDGRWQERFSAFSVWVVLAKQSPNARVGSG